MTREAFEALSEEEKRDVFHAAAEEERCPVCGGPFEASLAMGLEPGHSCQSCGLSTDQR